MTPPDLEIEDAFAQFSQITLKSGDLDFGGGGSIQIFGCELLVR